jgi:hypothetical protein
LDYDLERVDPDLGDVIPDPGNVIPEARDVLRRLSLTMRDTQSDLKGKASNQVDLKDVTVTPEVDVITHCHVVIYIK